MVEMMITGSSCRQKPSHRLPVNRFVALGWPQVRMPSGSFCTSNASLALLPLEKSLTGVRDHRPCGAPASQPASQKRHRATAEPSLASRPPLRPRMIARTRPVTAAGCLRSALDMLQVGVNL